MCHTTYYDKIVRVFLTHVIEPFPKFQGNTVVSIYILDLMLKN